MSDRSLVTALVAGDPRGLEGAYQQYADRLYTYCVELLADPAAATDALLRTFVLASQRAGQLREPDRLRCWLYAIARNECLGARPGRPRPAGEAPTVELPDLATAADTTTGRPRDREVLLLALRHELPAPEIGQLLGVSRAEAADRRHRAREQVDPALASRLAGAYRPAPALLWPRLELNCFDPGFAPERATILRRAGRFDPDTGFPRQRGTWHRHRRWVAVAGIATASAAVAVSLLAAGAGAVLTTPGDRQPDPPPAAVSPPGTAAPTARATGAAEPTASAGRTTGGPRAQPPRATVPPERSSAPAPAPPPPLAVQASGDVDCRLGGLFYTLAVTALADRGLATAELVVTAGSDRQTVPMEVDGERAAAETGRMDESEFTWWVEVTAGDGQSAGTDPVQVSQPCD